MIKFKVDPRIFNKFPGVRIGVLLIGKMSNKKNQQEIDNLLKQEEEKKRKEFKGKEIKDEPRISYWQKTYKEFGSNPRRYRPSVEALLYRVVKGNPLPYINPLVDLYNLISLKYLVPAGAEDLDKTGGNIVLGFAKGEEKGKYIGSDEEHTCYRREIAYFDDQGFICRRWNYREADRTKITKETRNCVLVIEAAPCLTDRKFRQILQETKGLLKKYLNAKVKVKILDKEDNVFNLHSKVDPSKVTSAKDKIDSKVVIGKIVSLSPHPEADRLTLVKVDIGEAEPLTIVCGANNIKEGQIVAVVLPGGRVLTPEGEKIKVKKVKIKGVESFGMLCSELELGVGQDHEGILILPRKLEKYLGQPLAENYHSYLKIDKGYLKR